MFIFQLFIRFIYCFKMRNFFVFTPFVFKSSNFPNLTIVKSSIHLQKNLSLNSLESYF